jgi:hypothetical protein
MNLSVMKLVKLKSNRVAKKPRSPGCVVDKRFPFWVGDKTQGA